MRDASSESAPPPARRACHARSAGSKRKWERSMSPDLATALRAETPAAPHRLRERIAGVTATTPPARRFTTRRILSFAVPVAAGLSLAAALAGLNTAIEPNRSGDEAGAFKAAPAQDVTDRPVGEAADQVRTSPGQSRLTAPIPAQRRAKDYRASLTLLVDGTDELSATTQRALRAARRLGGYVLSVNYSTPEPG